MERWRQYRHPKIYRSQIEVARRPKARASWKPSRQAFLGGLVVAVIGFLAWAVLGSGYFSVEKVVAQGEVTPALEAGLKDLEGRHILFVRDNQLFADLQQVDPALAELKVARGIPNEIRVHIKRRHPAFIWQSGETRWAIDGDGVAFPVNDPSVAEGRPVIIDRRAQPVEAGRRLLSPKFVHFIDQAFSKTPTSIGGRVERAEVDETTFYVYLVTEWGWSVILDTTRPLEGQLASLETVLRDYRPQIKEYIDLRVIGRAYLK